MAHAEQALDHADTTTGVRAREFHILSIDGGGIRGLFVAALLAGLEDDLGVRVAQHFDLIVGTSTGGILALGLGAGLTPREIVDFYVGAKDRVFADPIRWRAARRWWWSKHDPRRLEEALRGAFGDVLLGGSRVPLVVPSYDIGANSVHLFKTAHHPRLRRDHRIPMWQVAMATAAAPTYFPTFELPGDHVRLIDGGVWVNNPTLVGVAEAISMFGRSLDDLKVLSLGTTAELRTRRSAFDDAGLLRWVRKPGAVDLIMRGQSIGAFTEAQHLLGPSRVFRLDPIVRDQAALDRCDADELIAHAAHHSRVFAPVFESEFGSHRPDPYTPFHGINSKAGA